MNKREAKIRALKLVYQVIQDAIDSGDIIDHVDDDTTDDEAEIINDFADEFRFNLLKRIKRLEGERRMLWQKARLVQR